MNRRSPHLYELVLRQCAASAPSPWYPSTYVAADGVSREDIDRALDELRLGGLVRLTDWVPGQGQGYVLTQEGSRVASSPAVLTRLREWKPAYAAQQEAQETERAPNPRWSVLERGDAVRDALVHAGTPWITRLLIFVNIGVFVAGIFVANRQNGDISDFIKGRDTATLLETGAYNHIGFVLGEWWLLLTTCFVHAGVLHIGCNMLALQSVGQWAERMYAWWGMLLLYLISGVGGSVLAVGSNPRTVTVGASGAICGIFAALASWAFLNRSHLPPEFLSPFFRSLRNSAFFVVAFSLLPNVSWQAHLGGAVVGLITGGTLSLVRFHRGLARWCGGLCLLGIVAALAGIAWYIQHNDPRLVPIRDQLRPRQIQLPDVPALLRDTEEIWQTEVAPVVRLSPKIRDAERVQRAQAAIMNAEWQLSQALVLLQHQEPPHDEEARRERSQEIVDLQNKLSQLQVEDYVNFVYSQESEAIAAALKAYTLKLRPLLILNPSARNAELVDNALLDIHDEESRLSQLVKNAREHAVPGVAFHNRVLLQRAQLIKGLIDLYGLARTALQDPKAWTTEKERQAEALEGFLKSTKERFDQDVNERRSKRRGLSK
jgi:rhomboid protease GluP